MDVPNHSRVTLPDPGIEAPFLVTDGCFPRENESTLSAARSSSGSCRTAVLRLRSFRHERVAVAARLPALNAADMSPASIGPEGSARRHYRSRAPRCSSPAGRG